MGLMTTMRKRMHIVLWGLLFMFLLSMTIGGLVGGADIVGHLLGRVNPATTIARINDRDISPDLYQNLVNQEIEKVRSTGQELKDFHYQRARNTAWENLLQEVLVSQEVDRLNLTASDEEVLFHLENEPPSFLQQNPSFQTDGNFDQEKYMKALANPEGDEWIPIESFLKNTYIPNFKLQQFLDQSIVIKESDIRTEFKKRNLEFTINAIHITNNAVRSKVSDPSDEDLLIEYNKSKNDFKHEELRNIEYCFWKKEPSKGDSIKAESFAKEIAEKARNGDDFSNLANEFSQDPGNQNSNNGGDLGWFKRGRMVKPFEDAAFASNKGTITNPIKSRFGYHIIYVRDKKTNKDGDEEILASHILLKIETSATTLSNLKREATLFSYDAQDIGFNTTADSNKIEIYEQKKLKEDSFSINTLGSFRNAVRFAFQNEINSVSSIMENDSYFAVFKVDSLIPPGITSFDDVKSQLLTKIRRKLEKEATLQKANNLLIEITADGESIGKAKVDKEINVIENETKTLSQGFSSIGRSNFVNGALLSGYLGEIIGPLETTRGHTLLEIIEISPFDSTEFIVQRETLKKNLFNQKQRQVFESWLDNLKSKASITDNRKYYY
ncbi:MAG: hypothetical protein CMG62_02730 [Candidatus Marinimicrobia bacterium]|nr:hypothetical protein [Candidatus Neomarinimicrobiota bacterium]